jgi:GntR family transcriptional repressor for pyruvate dehydrogenase complex
MNIDTSPFCEIEHSRTAHEAVRQIERLLLDGVLSSGDRLPGERDLAERLDISRPVLREALKILETRGLVVSRHGGGTFVADLIGEVFSAPLAQLVGRHERATRDYLEFRREIEGHAAELAAARATDPDRARLSAILERMAEAHESGAFEAELDADIALHNAIGEAAHNVVLMHTLRSCYRLLSEGMFVHRRLIFERPDARGLLLDQHRAIVDAILARDPLAARRAAEAHIDAVAKMADEARLAAERDHVARLRANQFDSKPSASLPEAANSGNNVQLGEREPWKRS